MQRILLYTQLNLIKMVRKIIEFLVNDDTKNLFLDPNKPKSQKRFICVQSTIQPETSGFNETFEHIHNQLKEKIK